MFVAHRVQLCGQTTFRAANAPGNRPFLSRLAAVRCAFRYVASIIRPCLGAALFASSRKITLKIPARLQRTNRLYSVVCGPYTAGASFHRNPLLITYRIPLITRRSSTRLTPCGVGKYGPIRLICVRLNMNTSLMATSSHSESHPLSVGESSKLMSPEPRHMATAESGFSRL